MSAYFEYLRQMLVRFFSDLGTFFNKTFAYPWADVPKNFNDYGNSLERDIAKIHVNATVFRFDASDLMPTEVGSGSFWTGMVNYVSGAENAEQCLKTIDETWPR